MAARPIYRQMIAKLNQAGGMVWVFDEVAKARSLLAIAKELGVSRTFLSKECNRPTVIERYREAKKMAAEVHFEKFLGISKRATPVNAMVAKLQMDAHKWAAMVRDPQQFGNSAGNTNITVNNGPILLDALRKRNMDPVVTITKQIEGSEGNDDSIDG